MNKKFYLNNILLVVFCVCFFISCDKTNSINNEVEADGLLSVGVDDVEQLISGEGLVNEASLKRNKNIVDDIESFDGFDAMMANPDVSEVKAKLKANGKLAASALTTNFKYLLLLYKVKPDNTEEFFVQRVMTSGSVADKIPANMNTKYNWYAISYNSTETPPLFSNPANSANLTFELKNRDVLHASGTITTSNTLNSNNRLAIKFRRLAARIDVEFDARGMFAWYLDSVNVQMNVKQAVYNLKTGAVISNSDLLVKRYSSQTTNVEPASSGLYDRKVTSFYTAGGVTLAAAVPQLTKFRVVQHYSGGTAATDAYMFGTGSNVIGSWTNTFVVSGAPAKSSYYTAKINLIQKPITTGNTAAAVVNWGRGNLVDVNNTLGTPNRSTTTDLVGNNTNSGRRYRFRKQGDQYVNTANDWFRHNDSQGGSIPLMVGSIVTDVRDRVDPCSFVYPAGVWKTPSQVNFNNLIGSNTTFNSNVYANGLIMGASSSAPLNSAPYPTNNLMLNRNGEGQNVLASILYTYSTGSTANSEYWASEEFYFLRIGTGSTRATLSVQDPYDGVGQWVRHDHKNIRCVRR